MEEPNAVVQIEAPFPEPMLPATTVELYDGLVASSLHGQGRLATEPDPARYDAVHAHCDLLVVGAGPAYSPRRRPPPAAEPVSSSPTTNRSWAAASWARPNISTGWRT
ncbi:hypothetical protein HEP87_58635 [Streptomyces sp. S1D4-11]